jgi:hypothetical protein
MIAQAANESFAWTSLIGGIVVCDGLGGSLEPIAPNVLVDRLRDGGGRVSEELGDVRHVDTGF